MATPEGPAKAHEAAPAPQAPPEKPADARRRSLIVLSFWVLVALLGVPMWWRTTSIYRAELPLSDMMDWADGKVRARKPVSCAHLAHGGEEGLLLTVP